MTPWLVPVAYVLGALAGGFGAWSLWAWPARRQLQRVQAELLIAETQSSEGHAAREELRAWKARALESAELERKARDCVEQATRRAIAAEQELKRLQAPVSLPVGKRPYR